MGRRVRHVDVITDMVHVFCVTFFAGDGRAYRVRMLRQDHAAFLQQFFRAGLFQRVAVPDVGVFNVHHGLGNHGARSQQERGKTGDDFRIRESGHKTQLGFFRSDLAFLDHFLQLQSRHYAAGIPALVYLAFKRMVIGRGFFWYRVERRLAELDMGIPGSQVADVSVAVGKNNIAFSGRQLLDGQVDMLVQHIAAHDGTNLVLIGLLHRFLGQVKIVGIGRRLVVVVDKAYGDYPGREEVSVPEKCGCKQQQRNQDLQQRTLCVSLLFHKRIRSWYVITLLLCPY